MELTKAQYISGKGNDGMYTDRFPRIYAAGIRSKQPDLRVADCFNELITPNSVNDTKNTNIQIPVSEHVRSSTCRDTRNAGLFTESSELINPPTMTKFQTIVEDLKSTVYKSYWNKQVGKRADLTFSIPPDVDINNTTFGKKSSTLDNLYDIVMPNRCSSPEKNLSKSPGHQLQRNYCKASFDPNMVNGLKTNADESGKFVKCCLTDDDILMGTSLKQPILIARRNFQQRNNAELGKCLTPNKNIYQVPEGHAFGKEEPKDSNNVIGCLTYCEINPERELFYKCLAHLNTLRKCLSKRFDRTFFRNFYLQLRYLDNSSCGWLPKELIYRTCNTKFIRFSPNLIEPLLKKWEAINDENIEYKTFVNIINFTEPLPLLPKVWDILPEFTDFSTTYKEMVMPQQPNNDYRAGIPSGRYFDTVYPVTPDGCCKADRSYLPQESDAKACLCPSIFTLLGVSHRDMYTERDPEKVKRVFRAAGEDINDHMFIVIWDCAKKYHPKSLVSYETFWRALKEYKSKFNGNIVFKEHDETNSMKM